MPRLQVELANIWAAVGNSGEAKEAAETALKLKPGNEKALVAGAMRFGYNTEDAEQTRHYIEELQKRTRTAAVIIWPSA